MADVTIEASAHATLHATQGQGGIVWTSTTTGYLVYLDSLQDPSYRKTTDGGATWGAKVQISARSAFAISVWFDQWTPGRSGTKIHIVYSEEDTGYYRALDTSNDTLGTEVSWAHTLSGSGTYSGRVRIAGISGPSAMANSICVARGGNIYIAEAIRQTSSDRSETFRRSTDSGASFATRTSPWENANEDTLLLIPGNTSNPQDIAAIFQDGSATQISVKMYDDSANTWTETNIATDFTAPAFYWQFNAAVRNSDGHIFVTYWTQLNNAAANLKVYEITPDSITSPTVTARTNVITGTAAAAQCGVFIDNTTDAVYVAYLLGSSWPGTMGVKYKKSTDSGSSWGSETDLDETADGDRSAVFAGHSVSPTLGGRFMPVWFVDSADDLITNKVNSIQISVPQTVSLTGGITPSGALVRQTAKALAGTLTSAKLVGSLSKLDIKALSGGFTPAGTLSKTFIKSFAGTISSIVGDFAKNFTKSMSTSGAVTPAGSLQRQPNKALVGTLTPHGALSRLVSLIRGGAITPTGVLTRLASKGLTGAIASAGSLTKLVINNFAAIITPIGSLAKITSRTFLATLSPVGSLVNAALKTINLAGVISFAGTVISKAELTVRNGPIGYTVGLVRRMPKPEFTRHVRPNRRRR